VRIPTIKPLRFVWRRRRALLIAVFVPAALCVLTLVVLRVYSGVHSRPYIYTAETVPQRPVAIVFGASVSGSGRLSAMLADRVRMAAELYHAGKVQALLLTGDNGTVSYNEPEAMRRYALELGVPEAAITLDYAGFRTYDSCYRARDIFEVEEAVLLTQAYHLDRALLTCAGLGLDVVGVPVDVLRPNGYSRRDLLRGELREFVSTGFAVMDLAIGRLPRYLGDPLPIFAAGTTAEQVY